MIWLMLESDPDQRRKNMQEVVQQLRAVISLSTNISTHIAQAKHCNVNNVAGRDEFYSFSEKEFGVLF
jgi:hypothetical protein